MPSYALGRGALQSRNQGGRTATFHASEQCSHLSTAAQSPAREHAVGAAQAVKASNDGVAVGLCKQFERDGEVARPRGHYRLERICRPRWPDGVDGCAMRRSAS